MVNLWDLYKLLKLEFKLIDLTHEMNPDTPKWEGWPKMEVKEVSSLSNSLFQAFSYTTVGQYGTHVDAPSHMVKGGRTLEQIKLSEMIRPLCVVDKSMEVAKNADFSLLKEDLLAWEAIYGRIPEDAFVVFKSGWSKRSAADMDNLDENGNRHFPGWGLDAVSFLVEERNVGGIGHETSDTETPVLSAMSDYEVEHYILAKDRIQAELLTNLDECPPTGALFFCIFPKLTGGSGFPARCFALCPADK